MNCWHCDRPAHAHCKFCGRAVCKEHAKAMPHIVGLYRDPKNAMQALVTPDAVHCGMCKPLGQPVKLEQLA